MLDISDSIYSVLLSYTESYGITEFDDERKRRVQGKKASTRRKLEKLKNRKYSPRITTNPLD